MYRPTIGLEVHAELKTLTKLFCNSKNDPDESRPNVNICPVCMGYPGTLPVLNHQAVLHVLKVGLAVGGTLANYTEFDRKNYFYPDIPKGYQISQYKFPLVTGGSLRNIALERVHLEEDTARSSHVREGAEDVSLIDFNRAGVPLMELVTKPVIQSATEAAAFAKELQLLLRTLKAGDANLEKGEMRIEANISVSETETFGTKVEIKNLNSFRAVERAIEYEIKRQTEILQEGGTVTQETRGWDDVRQLTFSQRLKESAHDYRYFPDPDVPKLVLSEIAEFDRDALLGSLPELPDAKRLRYGGEYGIKAEDIEMYLQSPLYGTYFEQVGNFLKGQSELVRLASNYISSDLAGLYQKIGVPETILISPESFASLIHMVSVGEISSRGAKDLLMYMVEHEGGNPKDLAITLGLVQESDEGKLEAIVAGVIEAHPTVVEDFRAGKEVSLQFLVGQGMKLSRGSANPTLLRELLLKRLSV